MTSNWAFFTADAGNELCRGWQGTEEQAHALAQRKANDIGEAVEYIDESDLSAHDPESDDEAPIGEVVEPC